MFLFRLLSLRTKRALRGQRKMESIYLPSPNAPQVNVHPLVIFSLLNHHARREAGTRVIGALLGSVDRSSGVVEVTDAFGVYHILKEDEVRGGARPGLAWAPPAAPGCALAPALGPPAPCAPSPPAPPTPAPTPSPRCAAAGVCAQADAAGPVRAAPQGQPQGGADWVVLYVDGGPRGRRGGRRRQRRGGGAPAAPRLGRSRRAQGGRRVHSGGARVL